MTTPNLSPEHRSRLAALADLLDTVPEERFDMHSYYWTEQRDFGWDPHHTVNIRNECGTIGCALGWAPSLFAPLDAEGWGEYGERVFGAPDTSAAWSWVFSPDWGLDDIDNTPRGAAARIRHLLENGLPEDWREQMSGEAKLCYAERVEA